MARIRLIAAWTVAACACALLLVACDNGGGTDAGVDSGPAGDSGPPASACPTDPTTVPAPEELMGPCCYRDSNADKLAEPELRIAYIEITEPMGSPLSSTTVRRVLNEAVQLEVFNWLIRVEDAAADGAVNILTGFGRRVADGTYEFSRGAAGTEGDPDGWCPVEIPASLAGEVVSSDPIDGSITVPIFDDAGVELQAELTLVDIAIEEATFTEDRSCIGSKTGRPFTYLPAAVLTGYVELEGSRTQTITTPGVETTVCSALAGSISLTYCDEVPRAEWMIPPDALCDDTGCRHNPPGTSDVCDPLTTCNAWRFSANFAASGVDITNDRCGT